MAPPPAAAMRMKKTIAIISILATLALYTCALAGEARAPKPSQKDKCPVCGMFVYKYTDWIVSARKGDGSWIYFDGAKDFFKYHLADKGAITEAYVTEYYGLAQTDAKSAFYVIGSNVYGPMGHELVPFASRKDAEEFMADHGGRAILTFDEINAGTIEGLK